MKLKFIIWSDWLGLKTIKWNEKNITFICIQFKYKDEMFCFSQNEKKILNKINFMVLSILEKKKKILFKQKQIDIEYIWFFNLKIIYHYPTKNKTRKK